MIRIIADREAKTKIDFLNRNPGAVIDMEPMDDVFKDVREIRDAGKVALNCDDGCESKKSKSCTLL